MKDYEWFAGLTIPKGMYPIIRVDGHCFHRITKELGFQVPFDLELRNILIMVAKNILTCSEFDTLLAYIQSDEISFVLHNEYNGFNRRSEKISTLFSAYATVLFNREIGSIELGRGLTLQRQLPIIIFDARILIISDTFTIMQYLQNRQKDCLINCLNAYCYWKLIESGLTPSQASKQLHNLNFAKKNELLFSQFHINFNDLPAWEKRGTLVDIIYESKACVNHKTGGKTTCRRRKIRVGDCPDFQNIHTLQSQGTMLFGGGD